MECDFSGAGVAVIDVRAALEKKLTEAPVSVVRGPVQTEVRPKRLEALALRAQESDRRDIAVSGAPGDQRRAIVPNGGSMPVFDEIEHQVGPPAGEPIEQRGARLRDTHLTLHSDSDNPIPSGLRCVVEQLPNHLSGTAASIQRSMSAQTSPPSDWLCPAPGTRIRRFGPVKAAKIRRACSGDVSASSSPWITRTGAVMNGAAANGLASSTLK